MKKPRLLEHTSRNSATLASVTEQVSSLRNLLGRSSREECPLSAVFLYEDTLTREWSREVYERVNSLAGQKSIRPTWWKLSNLNAPAVLAAAVSTAMRAD